MSDSRIRDRIQGPWSSLTPCTTPSRTADAVHGGVLGRITFAGMTGDPSLIDGAPHLITHMANASVHPAEEIWRTSLPVQAGVAGHAVYAEDGEHLFYAVRLGPQDAYREPVRDLYETALKFAWDHGYPELIRMWNLIGDITGANADGLEIYRDFCTGRAEAFTTWQEQFPHLPAATGIGTLSPGVDLCFLAAKPGRAVHVENPRQTPAYKYSSRYGKKSPSFARATFLRDLHTPGKSSGSLFVSGTASILGDDTVHIDDAARQTEETLRNIEALVSSDNLRRHEVDGAGFDVKDLDQIKVYVRDAEHLPVVQDICASAFPADTDIAYFNVGVCRPDLLVEIEGVCR
ncbi:FkbO/Hyg5 family chorismatase [Streptomyces sp. NPDC050738]|uniref:FkbO/Hyg5 family chorismatase n=1 Tax=Streptomyces sp. NPDC050738 TaxID=3154744 RepID=UPI0034255C6F